MSPSDQIPEAAETTSTKPKSARALRFLRRVPYTALFFIAWLTFGATTGTLFAPAQDQSWYENVAIGAPSLSDGRWWTIFTSAFFVVEPYIYPTLTPMLLVGVGWAEWRFGTWRTILIFWCSHVIGMLGAVGVVSFTAWASLPFALEHPDILDVGPSCAALGCLIFAIATLPSPWRLRARIAVFLFVMVSVFYFGTFADVAHAIIGIVALIVSGLLPQFRRRGGRPTEREWRTLAFAGLITIGIIQVIDLLIPHDGPLGETQQLTSTLVVVLDVLAIVIVAYGIRNGYRLAWWVTMIYGVISVITAVVARVSVDALVASGFLGSVTDVYGMFVAPGLLWLGLVLLLWFARGAFRVRLRQSHRVLGREAIGRDEANELLREHGGGTISWMTTWPDNRRARFGDGYIAYQVHAGVAIGLADPIVSAETLPESLEAFARESQQAGLIPCFFSAGVPATEARPQGWRAALVAEDTIVDLPGLEFKGRSWGDVRTAMNRAKREGIEFRMTTLADEPWRVIGQVRAISEQWTGDKGLPEMRFTLGTVAEALDPSVEVALAIDGDGNLHGVLSWLPIYGGGDRIVGWTLDLMRRRDGGFSPVIEFLIASSLQHFSDEGYEFASLSGAPLVFPEDEEATPVEAVLKRISGMLEPLYGFSSLHRFKQKFNPRTSPLYLLYRDEGDLPRIGIALTRAYLPDASLRDLVTAARPSG
ncbi:bifunctional lysylphosphatidylglycerol flippase/synthetase MprF [Gulosibacter molinativorax]|uniref:DUF2156 domain-containing protein n=1 Tax=Gulosibacter molinativorax TaxID=256821 RepID=A0ABT7C8D8_9MICO|nr:DUF2156 domain-containing protein [Gulosibacter molinativorax]MDJ1371437.1 DUF2156 domain-containing protein [Gulosibacter molinativorax]QUY62935.1 Phosphatidylglycerol lysyltransferase [Gulosibacter molinativorax]